MSKYKAHIRYKTRDGTIVPGATTVTGILGINKRVLIKWANNMGLKGIDTSKYVSDKASIGTLAHALVTDALAGKKTNTDDYSKNQIDRAENSALSFWKWEEHHKIEPILIETPLSSERGYGGTADIYGKTDGIYELIDLKTGSGIYRESFIQTAAYKHLLEEAGYSVEKVRILNIPRTETESFQERIVPSIEKYWGIFLNCLEIYNSLKEAQK